MKALARSVTGIDRSPIRFILDRAAAYPDAIHLEIGQPDFGPPPHVIEAAVHCVRNEYTGYTANSGMLELRQAIVVKLARENNLHVAPENVMVTAGAMQAVYSTMSVLLNPGDEILLPDPGYGNFAMAAWLGHAQPRFYPTLPSRGFEPDLDAIERLISERTRVLFINSPSNPTGAVYSEETLRRCLEICRRYDLYLVSDETYERLVFEGQHYTPAQWDDEGRVISIFTTSKTYAMTGWRVGYACGPGDIIAAMHKVHQYAIMSAPTPGQVAALSALTCSGDPAEAIIREFAARRDVLLQGLRTIGLPCVEPRGAIYAFPSVAHLGLSAQAFSEQLLREERVAVVPGNAFGPSGEGHVRIAYTVPRPRLEEALERLERFVRRCRG